MAGIIWMAGYPLSGGEELRRFLHQLLYLRPESAYIPESERRFYRDSDFSYFKPYLAQALERTPPEFVAKLRHKVQEDLSHRHPDPVFVSTQNAMVVVNGQPLHHPRVSAGALYILRSPLQIAADLVDLFDFDQEQAMDRVNNPSGMLGGGPDHMPEYYGSWSTHVGSWTQRADKFLHVVSFDELVLHPQAECKRMVKFLKVSPERKRFLSAVEMAALPHLGDTPSPAERKSYLEKWREVLEPGTIDKIVETHREQMERHHLLPKEF